MGLKDGETITRSCNYATLMERAAAVADASPENATTKETAPETAASVSARAT